MRVIFQKEGIFVRYEKNKIKLDGRNDVIVHKKESPTELWWELKESIKGKRVKIIVYELDEGGK
ncbi:hypothetical protein [Thermococcus sp.]